ncbi:MAG: c-type cytochrome, partial [Steroidobacteraceae bacterium]
MHRSAGFLLSAGMFALASLVHAADGDAARGEKLAYTCLGCHGIEHYKNSYPNYSVPKLGGQNAAYIRDALRQFEAGSRGHPTMRGYASSLSDLDRRDLAAYFV